MSTKRSEGSTVVGEDVGQTRQVARGNGERCRLNAVGDQQKLNDNVSLCGGHWALQGAVSEGRRGNCQMGQLASES